VRVAALALVAFGIVSLLVGVLDFVIAGSLSDATSRFWVRDVLGTSFLVAGGVLILIAWLLNRASPKSRTAAGPV